MYVAEGVLFVAQIYQQVLQLEILKLRQLERPLIQLLLLGRAKTVKQRRTGRQLALSRPKVVIINHQLQHINLSKQILIIRAQPLGRARHGFCAIEDHARDARLRGCKGFELPLIESGEFHEAFKTFHALWRPFLQLHIAVLLRVAAFVILSP